MKDNCADYFFELAERDGIEISISTEPPVTPNPFNTGAFVCQHGISYWIEPTEAQIARWLREEETP